MRVLVSNPPWYKEPQGDEPGWRGVRAGSRWPHIFPYYSHEKIHGFVPDLVGGYIPFPFWLGTAGEYAKKSGFATFTRDSIALGETYENFYSFVNSYNPDVILIETATATLDNDLEIIKKIKYEQREIVVVVTGLHFELEEPQFLQENPLIDFTLYGEYEYAFVELLKCLEDRSDISNVPNLVYRNGSGEVVRNEFGKLIDLDKLPWPDRGIGMPSFSYFDGVCGLPGPQLQVMSSRGCPFGCIFCVWPQMFVRGRKYRTRSPEDVVEEIVANFRNVPYQSFYIDDDTFNIDKNHVLSLAKQIRENGLNTIPWGTMGRADLMDSEQLDALKNAGLYSIKYGLESSNQNILDEIDKKLNLERAIEQIHNTKEHGIKVHLTFTFGLPSDTPESIEKTIDMACQLPIDTLQFSIATPYPGTKMYNLYKQKGWLISERWSDYVGSTTAVIKTDNFTNTDLEEAIQRGYERFSETEIYRNFSSPDLIEQINNRLTENIEPGGKVVLFQAAKVAFVRYLANLLVDTGYELHIVTHNRFLSHFDHLIPEEQIHQFTNTTDFKYSALQPFAQKLQEQYGFNGAIIPYSNLSGGGYEEVEKIAVETANNIILGINLQGEIIR